MTSGRLQFRTPALAIFAGALLVGGVLPLLAMAGDTAPLAAKDGDKDEAKKTRIVLVTKDAKGEQKVEIENLGDLKDGESREVANAADGGKVTVTRKGDELVVKAAGGKEIRIPAAGESRAMAFASDDDGEVRIVKRMVRHGGEGGEPMIWMEHEGSGPGCGCSCCRHGGGHHAGMGHGGPHREIHVEEREMSRDGGPGGDKEVFVMHGGPEMHGAMIDDVIERLQASASFKELDAATRDKVLKALREQADGPGGARRVEVRVFEEKKETKDAKE